MAKGTFTAIFTIVIIVIILILLFIFRGSYTRDTSKFGTWNTAYTTVCDNGGHGCTTSGTQSSIQTCTPNPKTNYGCIGSDGKITYDPMITKSTCNPTCYSSIWQDLTNTPCQVYLDPNGNTLAGNQSCYNTGQFTLTKEQRQCVAFDASGSNACIRTDGSTAAVNEIDSITTPCGTIPPCFPGTWKACTDNTLNVQDCGGTAAQCGTVIPANSGTTSICQELVGGVLMTVPDSNCDPSAKPPDCTNDLCFNFPCAAYPSGYSNISNLLSSSDTTVYFELMDNTSLKICQVNYTATQVSEANAPSNILVPSPICPPIPPGDNVCPTPTGGPVTTIFDNVANRNLRFNIIPSPANHGTGGFYLFATLPGNTQIGIVSWDSTNMWLVVSELNLPTTSGNSLDDLVPQPQLFAVTGTSTPYVLNTQTGGINTSIITNLTFNICACACGTCNVPPLSTCSGTSGNTCPNV